MNNLCFLGFVLSAAWSVSNHYYGTAVFFALFAFKIAVEDSAR